MNFSILVGLHVVNQGTPAEAGMEDVEEEQHVSPKGANHPFAHNCKEWQCWLTGLLSVPNDRLTCSFDFSPGARLKRLDVMEPYRPAYSCSASDVGLRFSLRACHRQSLSSGKRTASSEATTPKRGKPESSCVLSCAVTSVRLRSLV